MRPIASGAALFPFSAMFLVLLQLAAAKAGEHFCKSGLIFGSMFQTLSTACRCWMRSSALNRTRIAFSGAGPQVVPAEGALNRSKG